MSTQIRHILITGASSGIGAALAQHYAAPGVTLSLCGRDGARLAAVAQACRERGAKVYEGLVEVTDAAGLAGWIEQRDVLQPVDLVIANAGISAGTHGQKGESHEQVQALFDVNVQGVLNTIHPLIPRMQARGQGQIALMSSLAGYRGWPTAPAYCASKAAVRVYGQGLRAYLEPMGVRVHVICPGFVRSPMTDVNDFPMPFLMDVEAAAAKIAQGLSRNKAVIAFPWPLVLLCKITGFIPASVFKLLTSRVAGKPALEP